MAKTQQIILSVPEISCEHCVKAINSAIGVLPGVEAVATDVPTHTVHVTYDGGQLALETIEAQLADAGYTVARE